MEETSQRDSLVSWLIDWLVADWIGRGSACEWMEMILLVVLAKRRLRPSPVVRSEQGLGRLPGPFIPDDGGLTFAFLRRAGGTIASYVTASPTPEAGVKSKSDGMQS